MSTDGSARLEQLFGPVAESTRCSEIRRQTLEQVVELAVEVAREGREGRKIGTLFTVGGAEGVLERSHALLLDPLFGHPVDVRNVRLPEFRETVKELAQLDGAFVVADDGTFLAAGRYIEVDVATTANFVSGLGTRHAAAASISRHTDAIAVVVSQSSIVRVFADGEMRAEILPELFLMSRERVLTPRARVRELPDAGLTMAVAADES
jgi:DNA integrity scanning protein DisA with diadenylate cyclase activity